MNERTINQSNEKGTKDRLFKQTNKQTNRQPNRQSNKK